MERFECHCHSWYSNLRLLDAISSPKAIVKRAIDIGLKGICITDHDTLSSHVQFNKIAQSIRDENPDFKIGLGNEIYLVDQRPSNTHHHFILIAKDAIGHEQLRRLSSLAWLNSYTLKGLERVDTLKSDLYDIIKAKPGHIIASTACLGSELDQLILKLHEAESCFNSMEAGQVHDEIVNFVLWCKDLFGDDFYIECQPGCSKEQVIVNKRLKKIAECFGVKMIVSTDAHYLKKEDRFVHKAYLNSKDGEREIDSFYEYAYLQTNEDIIKNLKASEYDEEFISQLFANTVEIYDKVTSYSLLHSQQIPEVEVKDYPKSAWWESNCDQADQMEEYPTLKSMFTSDNKLERYWVNECWNALEEKGFSWQTDYVYTKELEEEAQVKRLIGEKLGTNMFGYPVLLQHYIDMIWDTGGTVGAGRGSACSALNHYLLGITQLDPIQWNFPFFRYMNRDTEGLGDIDIDICPSKRPIILQKIREERKKSFDDFLTEKEKNSLGCVLVSTFTTEGTKSAILTGCRGYRSEEYPDGIDIDEAQYLASLVPIERGNLWTLDEILYGNPEEGRKPVKLFISEISQYPGLIEIIKGIEGCIKTRSSHASGVIMFDTNPYKVGCFMKTPTGEVITQYDLGDAEAIGLVKLDLLVTKVQDKITQTLLFLQKEGLVEKDFTIKQLYDKYLHPAVLPLEDKDTWETIQAASSLDLFQLDSEIGRQGAKKVKPKNMLELSAVNGLIRLMTNEKGQETPMEKYIRFRKDIKQWHAEMDKYKLTSDEKVAIGKYTQETFGIGISQEQLMRALMDPQICDFTLKEANAARKVVSKKKMDKIAELKKQVFQKAKTPAIGKYVWDSVVAPGLGYSFSDIHSISYSFIGFQTAYLATHWNPIFWNTACLVVNSGSLEEEEDLSNDESLETEEGAGDKKKEKNTDYGKIAKALGRILGAGIKVSLVDINKSDYSFKPDMENNEILFGMKALGNVGSAVIEQIIQNRPYSNFKDFLSRCPLNKSAMISLIKSGAFDKLELDWARELNVHPRYLIMVYYLSKVSEPKTKLTLQNLSGLIKKDLLPESCDFAKRVYNFNKYLKEKKVGKYYAFDDISLTFYNEHFNLENLEVINSVPCILQTKWDKIYQSEMDTIRKWLKTEQKDVLKKYNTALFLEQWEKYAKGNLSTWEMEALCFYYHEHELNKINKDKYGITNFFSLSSTPEVDYYFKRNGKQLPVYKTFKIIGTVISKKDSNAMVSLLTPEGVVEVKFTKEYYAKYKQQISERKEDGTKKVMEKGWFSKGTKLMITGFRRDDQFVAKTYAHTPTHQIYLIKLSEDGKDMNLTHNRYGEEEE